MRDGRGGKKEGLGIRDWALWGRKAQGGEDRFTTEGTEGHGGRRGIGKEKDLGEDRVQTVEHDRSEVDGREPSRRTYGGSWECGERAGERGSD
jgi:hypothetical protein